MHDSLYMSEITDAPMGRDSWDLIVALRLAESFGRTTSVAVVENRADSNRLQRLQRMDQVELQPQPQPCDARSDEEIVSCYLS